MRLVFFFFHPPASKASEQAKKESAASLEIRSRAGPHPAGRSDRVRLSTAAMDHTHSVELICGDGEEGERKRAQREKRRSQRELSSKLPKCASKHFERERRNRRPMARPRGGLPAPPTAARRRKGARERAIFRYVVNWRNARARETYLREGEAKG